MISERATRKRITEIYRNYHRRSAYDALTGTLRLTKSMAVSAANIVARFDNARLLERVIKDGVKVLEEEGQTIFGCKVIVDENGQRCSMRKPKKGEQDG